MFNLFPESKNYVSGNFKETNIHTSKNFQNNSNMEDKINPA